MVPVRQLICVMGTWRNPPNVWNKNAPFILENKISCSLTVVCKFFLTFTKVSNL